MKNKKMFHFITIIIYFTIIVSNVNCSAVCPAPNIDITPCECFGDNIENTDDVSPSTIRCIGEQPLDLLSVFEILNANIGPNDKSFDVLYINNTSIEEIPENTFKGFTFKEIYFDKTKSLMKIDKNAFHGLEEVVKQIHVSDTNLSLSAENASDISIFDSLKALEFIDLSTSECPTNYLLDTKCKCEVVNEFRVGKHKSTVITCKQLNSSEELIQVFNQLNTNLRGNKRNFFRFRLQESELTELTEDVFNGITFSEITITDCLKLATIHRNAFKSIKLFVNKLWITDISLNNNSKQLEDVWYAISSLSNLVSLHLVNVFNEIPAKAFKLQAEQTQWRLKYFAHSGYQRIDSTATRIKSIGSYAFYNLPNIQIINLQNNIIEVIDRYAFANQIPSDKQLIIRLSRNNLNPESLSIGSLAGSRRPIRLVLGQPFIGCNRDLTYLEERVFSGFLDKEGNELEMGCAFPMQCDCNMKWLYDAPYYWQSSIKKGSFSEFAIVCELENEDQIEEVSLWDLPEEYFLCDKSSTNSQNLIESTQSSVTTEVDSENLVENGEEYN